MAVTPALLGQKGPKADPRHLFSAADFGKRLRTTDSSVETRNFSSEDEKIRPYRKSTKKPKKGTSLPRALFGPKRAPKRA